MKTLETITRIFATVTAVSAIALAAMLMGEFGSSRLPVRVSLERFTPTEAWMREIERLPLPTTAPNQNDSFSSPPPAHLRDAARHWFRIDIATSGDIAGEPLIVSFSQGLVVPERVWRAEPATGTGLRASQPGDDGALQALPIRLSTAGRWVPITEGSSGRISLIAQIVSPGGVGQPKLEVFRASDSARAAQSHTVRTVAFTSTLLLLACFSAAVAAAARDWTFLIFAGWLLMSLRAVAVNLGWGLEWAARHVAAPVIGLLAPITLCIHALLTIALFRSLLGNQMSGRWVGRTLAAFQAGYIALGIASLALPHALFYRIFWAASALAIVLLLSKAAWITVHRKSSVAFLFLLSWLMTLGGMGAEILYSAGTLRTASQIVNAEAGALGGALACALALAQRLRAEIMARQAASDRERRASLALRRNYEAMPVGLFGCDRTGRLLIFNPAFSAIFETVTGQAPRIGESSLTQLIGEQHAAALLTHGADEADLQPLIELRPDKRAPIWLQFRVGGAESPVEATLEGSVSDVTSRLVAERRLEYLIDHDPLTGALNQRGLENALTVAIANASAGNVSTFAELHVDRFKTVNDLHGLSAGDAVLVAVHERIRSEVDPTLRMARIGDTLKILLAGLEGTAAWELAERILRSVAHEPFDIGGKRLNLTASIGLASITAGMSSRDVMTAASHASADAKAHGRNRIVRSHPSDLALKGFLEELSVQTNLRDRLDSDRFFLEFQPVVDLRDASASLIFEVLVRMRDDKGDVISPARFIPAAERNGQISMIDRWVLEKTLAWLSAHPQQADSLEYVSVNLSGGSLNDARFVDDAFALISRYPGIAAKICFEITETVALADRRATRRFADRVHGLGGHIALDDFGAGFTSVAYLKELDVDILKIDASFVCDLHENPQNLAITRMITDLAHQLGKRCVAEGVERPETVAALMALSVDYVQGFIMGRPQNPDVFLNARSSADLVQEDVVKSLIRGDAPVRDLSLSARDVFRPAML
jgi:diguanylate cyclase (GGDEF)-like protein